LLLWLIFAFLLRARDSVFVTPLLLC